MFIFNITFKVGHSIYFNWKLWLVETWLPAFMVEGSIASYKLLQLLDIEDEDGLAVALQLEVDSLERLSALEQTWANAYGKSFFSLWGDECLQFCTKMQVVK